ncbi:MAG TPA: alpha-amylase family protein [Flavisolibacter sp.]
MEQTWYNNALIYSLDVESFYDSNGDGTGDFEGLAEKLDSIAGLGATCIWLLPFYPSPNRDNGYDVMDYYNVDARLGTLGDFALFLDKANQLGIRVIIDLVVNHTSIQHPWFQQARQDRNSPFRDFYVWSDKPLKYDKQHLMFTGEEETVWTYDEAAGQYYLHRFYKEQPDLNIANPEVQQEILKIMGFWLRLGVHGFRIDAAEMLVEPYGLKDTGREQLLCFFNDMRSFMQARRPDGLLLAEVNSGPDEMQPYLHKGERMHMLFNFFVNQHIFLAFAEQKKTPLENALKALPKMERSTQWLHFLRHHDELNVKLLDKKDQEKVLNAFAPEEAMRIYGFGIRRRLAPLLGNDLQRLELAYSLLFSMPGAQMIRYGDETGMGDDLSLEGRTSVRTPMQWSPSVNGGFSKAPKEKLVHPVISSGEFSFEKVNVLAAQQNPRSLLNWLERLVTTRKQSPEIGCGNLFIIPCPHEEVMIHGYEWRGRKLFFLHNFSGQEFHIEKSLLAGESLYDVFGEASGGRDTIHLKAFQYHWLRTE